MAFAIVLGAAVPTLAQAVGHSYAGMLIGVSTLSADGQSTTDASAARISFYTPENGLALNLLAGVHLAEYFTVQANYIWNRNRLTLFASDADQQMGRFYEQVRQSDQHAFVIDGLIYFRNLQSRIRPYLSTGLSVLRFSSAAAFDVVSIGLPTPAEEISSARVGLRSAVGIDIAVSPRLGLRYSFSETLSPNPISPHLNPPGGRWLANFQNLVGIVAQF
jgi:hypothetical protein